MIFAAFVFDIPPLRSLWYILQFLICFPGIPSLLTYPRRFKHG